MRECWDWDAGGRPTFREIHFNMENMFQVQTVEVDFSLLIVLIIIEGIKINFVLFVQELSKHLNDRAVLVFPCYLFYS